MEGWIKLVAGESPSTDARKEVLSAIGVAQGGLVDICNEEGTQQITREVPQLHPDLHDDAFEDTLYLSNDDRHLLHVEDGDTVYCRLSDCPIPVPYTGDPSDDDEEEDEDE
jgi:hypothetical protein